MLTHMSDVIFFRKRGESKIYKARKPLYAAHYLIDFGYGLKEYTSDDVLLQFKMGRWIKLDNSNY